MLLDRLYALQESPESYPYGDTVLVRETDLLDPPGDYDRTNLPGEAGREERSRLVALESALAASLVAGLVRSESDVRGHVLYCLDGPPKGKGPRPSNRYRAPLPPKGVKRSAEARRLYEQTEGAELERIKADDPPSAREIGLIPISTCPITRGVRDRIPQTTFEPATPAGV